MSQVKEMLREMEEPICLFGEGPYERRERLKKLLVAAGNFVISCLNALFYDSNVDTYLLLVIKLPYIGHSIAICIILGDPS